MNFNIDAYMESRDRDYDYYLFWADDIYSKVWDLVCEAITVTRCQNAISHYLMDAGQEEFYQEDGYILGEIIFESVKQERGI